MKSRIALLPSAPAHSDAASPLAHRGTCGDQAHRGGPCGTHASGRGLSEGQASLCSQVLLLPLDVPAMPVPACFTQSLSYSLAI